MNKALAIAAAIALLCVGGIAEADVFNMGPGVTNLETVAVGDPGNTGELSGAGAGGYVPDRICGAVGYNYSIGKYEVTAAQYTDFLNHKAKSDPYGLYNQNMPHYDGCGIQQSGSPGWYWYSVASDWANRPVNYVTYWSSLRFANWLNNGQGNSDTETGAYALDGYNGTWGRDIQRSTSAKWFIPSEDEWYKAAYYKGGGTNAGYWDYPTQSDDAPGNQVITPDPGNQANYQLLNNYTIGSPYYRTNVGEFENSASACGTFDQGGNVWEWNESIVYQYNDYAYRGLRGGSAHDDGGDLRAACRNCEYPPAHRSDAGFRVASIPEPASLLALLCGLGGLVVLRRH